MAESGIVCSMSRSGNVWDNAAMESFFSSLKTERNQTRNGARADVFDYIDRFYNAIRRQQALPSFCPLNKLKPVRHRLPTTERAFKDWRAASS
jgi:putative transposase